MIFKLIIPSTVCGTFEAVVNCLTFFVSSCLKQLEPTSMALSGLEEMYATPK